MPQAGYGPVQRMLFDSVVTLPMGIVRLRNINGGRDTAQIRYNKSDSSIYVYTGSQWVKSSGSGSTIDTTSLSNRINNRVPYTGATTNVDLGNNKISTSATQLTLSEQPSFSQGLLWYDSTQKSLAFWNDASYSPVFVGQNIVLKVYNNTGSTIAKGAAVYIKSGGTFTYPNVALARADSVSTASVIGLMNGSTPTGSFGYVTSTGAITGVNTGAYSEGTILYLSPYASGQLMNTIPPTGYAVQVGIVAHANTPNGIIYTKQTTPLAISAATITGTLAVNQGGTGQSSALNQGGVAYASSTSALATTSAGTSGQLLTSAGTSTPTWTTLDSTIYFSKFRSDTMRSNVYTSIVGKQDTATSWKTGGNFNVTASQFIGSNNNASLRFRTNNSEAMVIDSVGKLQLNRFANNGTYNNAFSLTNTNNRAFFNLNTNSSISQISLKANNDAVADSMIINDSGLIQPRTNATLWLKPSQSGIYNVVANRCAACGPGSIFSANVGTSAPVFNVSSTGATSIGASSAAASSLVDMSSTSLGLLIPRMTTTNRTGIGSPATGLQLYDLTDSSNYTYDGTRWNRQLSANGLQTITGTSQGGSSANGVLSLSQTWNTTGNPTALLMNVTNTASGATSNLMDLQVGGTSQVKISKAGSITSIGNITANQYLGNSSTSYATLGLFQGTPVLASFSSMFNAFGSVGNITTGTKRVYYQNSTFAPTSGTAIYSGYEENGTINQTGGANGITRGIWINPTLTAAADFRGLEITNGSVAFPYTAQSATYAIKNNDYTINCTANTFTATLPTAVGCTGRIYTIVNSGAGTITIGTTSSQTFVNVATTPTTLTMATVGTRVVQSNGTNWLLISSL